MTARWVVDVSADRDLHVVWRPISLYWKNDVTEEADSYERVFRTHRLLRVMESVRDAEGDDAVGPLYTEYGRRTFHDREPVFDPAEALAAVGLDTSHAAAFDDETWDAAIRKQMDDGLSLVGDDVGTPIIAWEKASGERIGYFGPVITSVPPHEQSLRLWDALLEMSDMASFWELKRTRTERPDFGERP